MKTASKKTTTRKAAQSGAASKSRGEPRAPKTRTRGQAGTASGSDKIPLIVGVGASAGGLEAFTQLLRAMPPDTGMAFVLVQHLEPRHESILTKRLSTATPMPVTELKQGMQVQSNHVYVIGPNADIGVKRGVLHPAVRKAPAGRHMPIDHFFRSLAEDLGARAIGVILSGTASDGTLGLKAIKSEGGITFAQEPDSARYDGMPRSAIAAGCVDLVLPPEGIAKELSQISRHPYIGPPQPEEAAPLLTAREEDLGRIFRLHDDLISIALNEGRELERKVRAEDGRWYSMRIRPYWTSDRKIDGVLMALVDIHELKENQDAVRREERFVSAILDAAGRALLVAVLDPEGRIVHFNRACQELTGYSLEEVKGRRPWDFLLVPEETAGVKSTLKQLAGGTANEHENHWLTKDGRRRLIAWSNSVAVGEDGRAQYVIGTGIDVTERQQAREQAQQSEATVRALLETAAQAILAVDSGGKVVLANAAAETMFGCRREEILGQALENLIPPRLRAQHARHLANFVRQPRNRPMGMGLDLAGLRKDGTEFPVEVSLSHVPTKEGTLAVAFITDITERKRTEDVLRQNEAARASQQQLRALTAGLLEAQEQERRRLSRELHDDLNQKLAMLAVELGNLEAKLPESEGTIRSQLRSVESRVNGLSDDVRRTAYQLHPSILEHLGLGKALESYCSDFFTQEGIKVSFKLRNMPGSIPEGIALCLYRVVQEGLGNVAKHSGALRASVMLAGAKDGLLLTVSDTGHGFDRASVRAKGGLGLVSIEERVAAAGGTVTIKARPGDGTRVQVWIPLPGESG